MITQQKIPLEGLLKRYEESLIQAGYCLTTRYDILRWSQNFISMHLRNRYDYMNRETINQFMKEKDERRYTGKIGQEHYQKWKRLIERFILFAYTGKPFSDRMNSFAYPIIASASCSESSIFLLKKSH